MYNLLDHPFWDISDPESMRLVRVFNFPPDANPFAEDGVVLRIAASPGEAPFHKYPMAREGILEGVRKGGIGPDTVVVEATSGNTGLAMAMICTLLKLRFVAVVAKDIPESKISFIRALGEHINVQTPNPGETTAECARRLGTQSGWYNPDQYSGAWNPHSYLAYLAPQLFRQTLVSVFATPGGTMGTCMGIAQYALQYNQCTRVIPVMCEEGQEVPAARTLTRVKKDVRLPWEKSFKEADIRFGTRYASFLLSFLSWRHVPVQLGPSFGLAFVGMLKFLQEHKAAGTLDQFREVDGKIYAVVFGPDEYRPYAGLYLAEALYEKDFSKANLLDLIDLR